MIRPTFFLIFIFVSFSISAKTLFFGDSLTYVIGQEFKRNNPDTDIIYNVGFSFRVNHEFMFNTIDETDLIKYETIYIVFGTNDFIQKGDIDNYSILTALFISRILNNNNKINIVWILPPTLKNSKHNILVSNTRESIKRSLIALEVRFLNVNDIFGNEFNYMLNNKEIRTKDGIHITNYGAKLIVEYLNML